MGRQWSIGKIAGCAMPPCVRWCRAKEELQRKVEYYWEKGTGWRWKLLQNKLSFENMVKLASVVLQDEEDYADKVEWMLEGRGQFTVKDTYKLARGHVDG